MSEFLMSIFGSDMGGEIAGGLSSAWNWLSEDSSGGLMSSNLMSGVHAALGGLGKMAMKTPTPVAHSSAYHFQSNANPTQLYESGINDIKNPDITNQAFNSLKGLF